MKNLASIIIGAVLFVMLSTVVYAADINDELFKAVSNNDIQKVNELISKGASINAKGTNGRTPLMIAVLNNRTETAKLLIEKGADVNAKNNNGDTALSMAEEKGKSEMAKLPRQAGAQ